MADDVIALPGFLISEFLFVMMDSESGGRA
jgi:hypothetical protein